MTSDFQQALVNKDIQGVIAAPKSDLHCHAGRGGNISQIEKWSGKKIALPPAKFQSLDHMQQWYSDNIRALTSGLDGQKRRWEACFQQAAEDHLQVFALSFSSAEVRLVGGMEPFIEIITGFIKKHSPNTLVLPELTYDRAVDVSVALDELDYLLDYKFFKSLDICCDEFAQPIKNFKPLYRKAKEHGVKLKAHVGEFGTADDVMEAIEELELDEVHHGIAAAQSKYVTDWLARHHIQLNICPSSNVMLDVVDEYKNHPIQKLFRAGVPVTINTDDLLIFNQSVSQEYMNLFSSGALDEKELDEIRLTGLNEK